MKLITISYSAYIHYILIDLYIPKDQFTATPNRNDMNTTVVFQLSAPGQTGKQVTVVKGEKWGISPILNLLLDN
jgi:hypothetical protein